MLNPQHLQANLLTIVNCNKFHGRQAEIGAYACPTKGGAGTFRNAAYMGLCWGQAVHCIAEVQAVVAVNPSTGEVTLLVNNAGADVLADAHLRKEAGTFLRTMFPDATAEHLVFILGKRFNTNFHMHDAGGMQYRKTYRDIACVEAADAQELAHRLDGHTWDDYCG